jgi:hypothetical protein
MEEWPTLSSLRFTIVNEETVASLGGADVVGGGCTAGTVAPPAAKAVTAANRIKDIPCGLQTHAMDAATDLKIPKISKV